MCYRNQGYLLVKAAVQKAKNSLYKNDTPKDADVQIGRAPFLPVETPEELKFITEIER